MTTDEIAVDSPAPPPNVAQARILIVACLMFAALIIPFRAVASGWLPPDDALRHAAKVVSGQPWSEILVLRPEIRVDSHPGWHGLLAGVRALGIRTVHGLVVFQIVTLCFLVIGVPHLFFRRPEAWSAALAIWVAFDPHRFARALEGRPFLVTLALVLFFCLRWQRLRGTERPLGWMAAFAAAAALSTWLHGVFYLLAIPVAALLLAREWVVAVRWTAATLVGVVVGLVLTGSPVAFAVQTIEQLLWTFASHGASASFVAEYYPYAPSPWILLLVAVLCLLRAARGAWSTRVLDTPVAWLAALGWTLGHFVGRFWQDWGQPALLVWIALEIEAAIRSLPQPEPRRRLLAALALAGVLVVISTADVGFRWSRSRGRLTFLPADDSRLAGWRPEPGGVLYSTSMRLFYRAFYENPRARWRYVLGFEPTWMPAEDLAVLRAWMSKGAPERTLEPWVRKLRPPDRLILTTDEQPAIDELEWFSPRSKLWIGRLPRSGAASPAPETPTGTAPAQ